MLAIPTSPAEEQFAMLEYENIVADMSEIIIQYGYVTFFFICLPIVPVFAFLNNLVELKVDGIKLVRNSRRPLPFGAKGLGRWISVLEFFSFISVITNAAIFTLVTDNVKRYSTRYYFGETAHLKLKFFIIFCTVLLIIIGMFKILIKDMPASVTRHLRRQQCIEDVLVKGQRFNQDKLN